MQAHTRRFPVRKPKPNGVPLWIVELRQECTDAEWADLEDTVLAGIVEKRKLAREADEREELRAQQEGEPKLHSRAYIDADDPYTEHVEDIV